MPLTFGAVASGNPNQPGPTYLLRTADGGAPRHNSQRAA